MGGCWGAEAAEEVELGALEEAELDPAEHVVHEGLGVADLLVAGPAGGLETGVGELFAQHLERHAVLQRERDGGGEGIHQAADGAAFFGHADEDFAGLAVGVEAYGDVALVPAETELVGDAEARSAGRRWRTARGGCLASCESELTRDWARLAASCCWRATSCCWVSRMWVLAASRMARLSDAGMWAAVARAAAASL